MISPPPFPRAVTVARAWRCLPPLALALLLAVPSSAADGFLSPTWVRTLGTTGTDQGWGVEIGPGGEVYLAGFVQGNGMDAFLARLDAGGNVTWEQTYARPFGQKLFEVRRSGDYLYAGGVTARTFSVESQDMLLLKVWASNGTLVWERSWNGPADRYDEIDGIVVEDGLVYVSGWADITLDYTQGDMAIVKFSEEGAPLANTTWGGAGREEGNGGLASDGVNLYVTGIVDGVNLFVGGDAVVVAFNQTTLAEVWNRTWGGSSVDDGYGLTLHGNALYVVGLTTSFGGDRIFLLRYDLAGNEVFNTTWGGAGSESARAVGVSPNGSAVFVAARTTSEGNGSGDLILLEFDPAGNLIGSRTWGGTASEAPHGIAVAEAVYIAGDTSSQGQGGSDLFLLKIGSGGGGPEPPGPPPGTGRPSGNLVAAAVVGGVVVAVILVVLVLLLGRRRSPH